MKRVICRTILFLAPLIIWQVAELFFIPINAFTFRAWETLSVSTFHLPGPFYPNQDLKMFSAGDQQPRTPVKWVRFITDKYGFRNRPEQEVEKYDVVVIGDSNVVGSHVDQENMLSEVLAKKCNCSVYNYAYGLPRNILSFFNDPRFKKNPPKHLVFEMRRGDVKTKVLETIPRCDYSKTGLSNSWDAYSCRPTSWTDHLVAMLPLQIQINLDRFTKQPFFHFAKSRLKIAARPSFTSSGSTTPDIEELVNHSVTRIREYSDEAKRRGINFIFLFFPYFQHDVDHIITKLDAMGINTIGFLPDEKHSWDYHDYNRWIHKEDSHWLESSIVETADLIMERLRVFEKSATHQEYSSLHSSSQSRPQQ